jgi:hypothetical protein
VASGALAFAAVVSPPVLLLVERGNIDAVIFAGLVIPLFLMAKRSGVVTTCSLCGLIAFLAILKIYPIAAAIVLAHRKFGFAAMAFAVVLAVTGLLCAVGLSELKTIAQNTPQTLGMSYGDMPIFIAANSRHLLPTNLDAGMLRMVAGITAIVLAALAFSLSLFYSNVLRSLLPVLDPTVSIGAVAIACVAIFCFSFLLGTNFDYRLVFLLGVMPVLLNAYDAEQRFGTLLAAAAIVLFLWLSRISSYVLVPFEVLDWSLFTVGVMWLTQTVFLQSPVNDQPLPG